MGVGTALDRIDKARHFREERVVVSVHVSLFVVVSGSADVEGGSLVGVDQAHVVAVCPDFEFTGIGVALEGDSVRQGANGAVFVFPRGQQSHV